MRSLILFATSSLMVVMAFTPVSAQLRDDRDLADLCSKFPLNSRCIGYSREVALEKRPGEAGACVMIIKAVKTETVCKLSINGQTITTYYEFGDKISYLDNKKASQEIQISPSNIKAIRYRETEKDNSTARVVNTLVFGLPGLFGTRDKKVSVIEIEYIPDSETGSQPTLKEAGSETLVPSSDSSEGTNNTVRIVVKRRTGEKLVAQLQELTGLRAELLLIPR
jgi:hypothetical protein